MAHAGMEATVDGWIGFCEHRTAYENFALIGLLFLRPGLPLSIIATSEIVNAENVRGAEKWSESRFRQLLLFYCEKHNKPLAQGTAALIDKADAVKGLAPLLVSTFALPLGIAVAFLFWALGTVLNDWCEKYSKKKYNGKGKYVGDFPEKEVDGFFDVTYLPQIVELVEDPAAYPLQGYRIKVRVESETNGQIKVPTSKELKSIQLSFSYDKSHSFDFTDTQSNRRLKGQVKNVSHVASDGPNVLRFISTDMQATPA